MITFDPNRLYHCPDCEEFKPGSAFGRRTCKGGYCVRFPCAACRKLRKQNKPVSKSEDFVIEELDDGPPIGPPYPLGAPIWNKKWRWPPIELESEA